MKSIRNFFTSLFKPRIGDPRSGAKGAASKPSNAPRIDFSYTVYWTKHVRQWDAARRAAVRESLVPVLNRPDFEPNAYARRYTVPGLDDQAHSGASLIALKKVLAAFAEE